MPPSCLLTYGCQTNNHTLVTQMRCTPPGHPTHQLHLPLRQSPPDPLDAHAHNVVHLVSSAGNRGVMRRGK